MRVVPHIHTLPTRLPRENHIACGSLLYDHHAPIEASFENPGAADVFLNFLYHSRAAFKPPERGPPAPSL